MFIHKCHPIPLYGTRSSKLHIIIVDQKDWDKTQDLLNLFSDTHDSIFSYNEVSAFATVTEKFGVSNFWIVIKNNPKCMTMDTVGHEIVHTVNAIFKSRGIKLDVDNDEPQAYLTGWMTGVVYQTIKKYLK